MYSMHYVVCKGWMLMFNGQDVGVQYHLNEWDCIDELASSDPIAAHELRSICEGIG